MNFYSILLVISIVFNIQGDPLNIEGETYDFVVAKDGSGDFKTIMELIDSIPDFRKIRTKVFIKNGIYKEKIVLPTSKTNVSFIGEDKDNTVLTFDDFASKKNRFGEEMGTTGSSSFFIFGDGFSAQNLSFENSSGPVGQAVAVRITADRVSFKGCKFLGFQDTLYLHGRGVSQYFEDCYIEGTVDFIFGSSTAFFNNCVIYCKSPGYITAASTPQSEKYGFIFYDCKIEGNVPEHSVYLGRPWRDYAKTVWINCSFTDIIKEEGWHNWNKPEAEKTTFYGEFNSYGPGSEGDRVEWAKTITLTDSKNFSMTSVFNDDLNWIPWNVE